MMSNIKGVSCLLAIFFLVIFCGAIDVVVAAPYQDLPPRAGHIPVYIREGNQSLSEIHPGLAEAFHEVLELEHKPEKSNSKTLNNNGDNTGESKNENVIEFITPNPPETDIASFDVIKKFDDNEDSLSKSQDKKEEIKAESLVPFVVSL